MSILDPGSKQYKTAVVVGRKDILSTAIQYLLSQKAEWRVFGIEEIDDTSQLVSSIIHLQPDIVIIDKGSSKTSFHPVLLPIQEHTEIKVVFLSLEDNLLNVYNKQTILIKETNDLLSILDNVE